MPNIEFDGQGVPISEFALPPFGSDSDLPQTTLTFNDNTDFLVEQYRELGFTHYEAWCVGGSGGRGGDASSQLMFIYEEIWRPVPPDVWGAWLALFDNTTIYYGWDPANPSRGGTQNDIQNFNNPNQMLKFRTYKQILLYPTIEGIGGAGGGGGLQKVAGLLADLADTVPIVVGKAGADSPVGQTRQFGLWTPPYTEDPTYSVANAYLNNYLNSYPGTPNAYLPPQPGGNGGFSSFAGICQASGGKGGTAGKVWDGSKFIIGGGGGAGGIGGSIVAGGGGSGSVVEGVNGSDGTWIPETGIGAGGGGGKGGRASETSGDPRFGVPAEIRHQATAGGQGSYSFADTTVFGARQFRLPWTYQKPVRGYWMIPSPGPYSSPVTSWPNGAVLFTPTVDNNNLVTPGGGGGARPIKNLKVGSQATGYSPNGVVVLRLTRIT